MDVSLSSCLRCCRIRCGVISKLCDRYLSHYFIQLDPNIFDDPKYPNIAVSPAKATKNLERWTKENIIRLIFSIYIYRCTFSPNLALLVIVTFFPFCTFVVTLVLNRSFLKKSVRHSKPCLLRYIQQSSHETEQSTWGKGGGEGTKSKPTSS
jgi:hypothetical protein